MLIPDSEYNGYVPHMEFGAIVWYRTTKSKSGGVSANTKKEIRYGTEINRIVTSASELEEAKKQLDRKLSKPKATPAVKAGPNQQSMF